MTTATLENSTATPEPPAVGVPPLATGSEAWRSIAIYHDGSGKAGDYYDSAIKQISEREEVHRVSRAFIAKHLDTLAGCYWRVAYLEAALEIHWGYYRGKHAKPADLARLWPVKWKRVREKYTGAHVKWHWEAALDGMTLRIVSAETEEPRPTLREGETVCLPNIELRNAHSKT